MQEIVKTYQMLTPVLWYSPSADTRDEVFQAIALMVIGNSLFLVSPQWSSGEVKCQFSFTNDVDNIVSPPNLYVEFISQCDYI